MRNLFQLFSLLGVTAVALTQLAAEGFQTTNAQPRDDWWIERHEAKLKEVADKADSIDLVFIGDSITHFMDDRAPGLVEETFPGMTHLNLGYSADRTENVLWRLQNGELDGLSPEVVVLMIGTNNTGHNLRPAAETAQGIQKILDDLAWKWPDAKVVLTAIFPRGATTDDAKRQRNSEINALLQKLDIGHK